MVDPEFEPRKSDSEAYPLSQYTLLQVHNHTEPLFLESEQISWINWDFVISGVI